VTKRLMGSVTVTGIRTTFVSTRISALGPLASGAVGFALASIATFGLSALRTAVTNTQLADNVRSQRNFRDVIGPSHSFSSIPGNGLAIPKSVGRPATGVKFYNRD